ncbi:HIRAN domain-containing protein [Cryptosporangium japonicum]|uniref:HIRAN domain-containing protein n=1 Tax=Cryptosporangium japonicum TaxID=80872 RepID=A0ABN0VBP3_9ACTN
MSRILELWGQRGWAAQEVAGETHHLAAIQGLFGGSIPDDGAEMETPALLVPDPHNPHDRNAVEVRCRGALVGYLPREDAARYAPILTELVRQGWTPSVSASVWCGYGTGRVRLSLAEPHMLVPLNLPPSANHTVLPDGHAIQVTGEEQHLRDLAPFLRAEGEAWVYATLHELTEQRARSTRTVVEVRVDDQVVGTLTPRMSGELLPVVRFLAEHDSLAVSKAIVKGNRLKADVTLYAARAGDLPPAWLDEAGARRRPAVDPGGIVSGHVDAPAEVTPRVAPAKPPQPVATVWRFNPPPGWPSPPREWRPPPGWRPDPRWPDPPAGWAFWVEETVV